MDTEEYTTAINDYYTDKITKEQVEAVARAWELNCDLSGWNVTPRPTMPIVAIAIGLIAVVGIVYYAKKGT